MFANYKNGRMASAYPASHHDPQSRSRSNSVSQSSGHASPTPQSSQSVRGVRAQYHPQDVTLPHTQHQHAHPHPQRHAQPQPHSRPQHPHPQQQIGAPTGPTNHVMVPQVEYQDDERDRRGVRYTADLSFRHDTITFQTANIPELGVRVGKISHSHYPPPIQGADDEVFAKAGDREVRLWIQWPGYSAHPLQKRIKTQGGKLTRQLLLTQIANMVLDFAYDIHRKKIPVERGYSEWAIGDKKKIDGIIGGELFITRLVHCGGSNWQPEIWAPRHW
ncbi:hypothetical protein DXG03_001680 [Asterophora parasitica]|uniref:Uncharacterized protein n=1 Tax=Asterophora parasitica TaxID=117018 RepID=A0A9P7GH14_9AGAR|nr:hypothetical protein DXG03_001680 [Asterophora parasitica]